MSLPSAMRSDSRRERARTVAHLQRRDRLRDAGALGAGEDAVAQAADDDHADADDQRREIWRALHHPAREVERPALGVDEVERTRRRPTPRRRSTPDGTARRTGRTTRASPAIRPASPVPYKIVRQDTKTRSRGASHRRGTACRAPYAGPSASRLPARCKPAYAVLLDSCTLVRSAHRARCGCRSGRGAQAGGAAAADEDLARAGQVEHAHAHRDRPLEAGRCRRMESGTSARHGGRQQLRADGAARARRRARHRVAHPGAEGQAELAVALSALFAARAPRAAGRRVRIVPQHRVHRFRHGLRQRAGPQAVRCSEARR